jgi:hypothetical protein
MVNQEEKTSLRLKRGSHLAAQWLLVLKSWIKPCLVTLHYLMVTPLIDMPAVQGNRQPIPFDKDSVPIGIDNRCTACITYCLDNFVSPPKPTNRTITGFGGHQSTNLRVGTLKWKWANDQGHVHTHLIKNSFYAPGAKVRLLSPQHWMQTMATTHAKSASCTTQKDLIVFRWGTHQRTVPLDANNVATFYMAPGFKRYHTFVTELGFDIQEERTNPLCIDATIRGQPRLVQFDKGAPKKATPYTVNPESFKKKPSDIAAEFLEYHYTYGHISPKKIQLMAKQGLLPGYLAKGPIPLCTAFLYGKVAKTPWRSMPTTVASEKSVTPTIPGQCVSVDFLTSPTPGIVAQMTGIFTHKRYNHASVYVDQSNSYGYVFLQKSISEEEKIQGKEAFERHCLSMDINIQHCHADNGIFASNAWRRS